MDSGMGIDFWGDVHRTDRDIGIDLWGDVVTSLVLVCSRLALHVCIMFNFSNELEMETDQTLAPDQIN